ncbi:MAG TPA: hypothetical protein VGH78_06235 [Solirubrobacteraceae bacterium]
MERAPAVITAASRWRPAALGLGCVCALIVIGCGSGQSSVKTAAVPSRTSAPKSAETAASLHAARLTRARALAFAHAVNLTTADVAEARVSKKRHGHRSPPWWERRGFERCVGVPAQEHELAAVESPTLLRGHELETEWISSEVTVATSVGTASRAFQALRRPAARRCLARLVTKALSRIAIQNAHWGPAAIYALPVPVPLGNSSLGLRIALTVNVPAVEVTMPAYVDVLGFARGPAEIVLATVSLTQPVPTAVEHELVSTLAARASSHAL